jgi:hypothetical protein
MHRCERCGETNPSDASYCATCGLALVDPGGVSALLGRPDDDVTERTSEAVEPPAFGETGAAVAPPSFGDEPSAPPPVAGVPTTVFPVGPRPGVTAPIGRVGSGGDPSGGFPAPASESRANAVMIAALAIAVVVIAGGVFVLLVSGSDGGGSTAVTATSTTTFAVETVAPSSVPPEVVTPVTEAVPVESTVAESTVPPPTPPPSAAPTAPTAPPGPVRAAGDLGLTQPILDEACDGRYITFVGSAVGAAPYADEVATLLARYPGSNYIWTKACPSLRQEFRDGNDIYGVVFGPYPTREEACAAVSFGPPDAYVRRISTTDPEDHTVDC